MLEVVKQLWPAAEEEAAQALWVRARRPERDCDQALTGTARHWLRRLPTRRRPLRLCIAHPRVANRIAWCWQDPDLSAQVLEDLLHDRRGGRRGFAPAIVRELQRRREFNDQQRVELCEESLLERLGRVVGVR
jgi:hypothetical protein